MKNKFSPNFRFLGRPVSRFKGVFVNFEPFVIVSLLSGLFAQKALSNTFNLVYIEG